MSKEIARCFKLLEIGPNSSPTEVKQAYRDLVKVWHPDRFPNKRLQEKANEKLKILNEAYSLICSYHQAKLGGFSGESAKRPDSAAQSPRQSKSSQEDGFPNDGKTKYFTELGRIAVGCLESRLTEARFLISTIRKVFDMPEPKGRKFLADAFINRGEIAEDKPDVPGLPMGRRLKLPAKLGLYAQVNLSPPRTFLGMASSRDPTVATVGVVFPCGMFLWYGTDRGESSFEKFAITDLGKLLYEQVQHEVKDCEPRKSCGPPDLAKLGRMLDKDLTAISETARDLKLSIESVLKKSGDDARKVFQAFGEIKTREVPLGSRTAVELLSIPKRTFQTLTGRVIVHSDGRIAFAEVRYFEGNSKFSFVTSMNQREEPVILSSGHVSWHFRGDGEPSAFDDLVKQKLTAVFPNSM